LKYSADAYREKYNKCGRGADRGQKLFCANRGEEFSVRAISTEKFITAKISGNALKQGSRTSD